MSLSRLMCKHRQVSNFEIIPVASFMYGGGLGKPLSWVVLNGKTCKHMPQRNNVGAIFVRLVAFEWDTFVSNIWFANLPLCGRVLLFGFWRSSWHCHQLDWGMNIDECQQNLSKIWARAFWYHWHGIMPVLEYWTKSGSIWPTIAFLPDKFFIL